MQAEADARQAIKLAPTWPKPLHRLAQALQGQQRWEEAITACQEGMALPSATRDFHPLRDAIAVQAALAGCFAGFQGRWLDVRDAGEEAWLGKEAPEDPALDVPEDEPLLMLPPAPGASAKAAQKGATAPQPDPNKHLSFARRGTSFRSVHAAMTAARDGDHIILRKGIHNGLGESIQVKKRVLIRGSGALGEASLDFRGNSPAFRFRSNSVLINLEIDFSGFREAVRFEEQTGALMHRCIIKCSGDDGVHVCERAAPRISRCSIQGKKCGVWVYDKARPVFNDCTIEDCGLLGVKLFDTAFVRMLRCTIKKCAEDAVNAQDRTRVEMEACAITECKGPALDLSQHAQAYVRDSLFRDCSGAVWVWDKSKAQVRTSQLHASSTYVVLTHGDGHADIQMCRVEGKSYMAGLPQKEGLESLNNVAVPQRHIGVPAEDGAFDFVPNPYTRKQ
ncbi:hypothetical protein CVIRNUC_006147 [Coccomyxa viridis]|uniref:Right handed beta helix domain-containing protein n=1 Tax=Coccomyxa viridis TaxID=1274662 RepID=A0AAV1I9R2_9CHLO|nr:hypothetical protein CVIRNUC_006147 [Coccomyxa viridis]